MKDEELWQLHEGAAESDLAQYFKDQMFASRPLNLRRSDTQPMLRHTFPLWDSTYPVSNPVPDVLYGYSREVAFSGRVKQLARLDGGEAGAANTLGLVYPFFVAEFKGDGPSGAGSLWVATNQCLCAAAYCVNIANRLNRQVGECKSRNGQQVDSVAFSVAMNSTEARLFVSWSENDTDIYMRQVEAFALARPEHHLEFRRYVRNILD
ncbi:hypothetical protein CDD80_6432 [Ophiocordyceps camponoti-rufipedis]|uniref:DUF7924 domain-containing protein n=1 Tax=Ophiocordyceps camponoti-rufipedis TaxID=2004952 RepID=A0A2C5ZGZ0_9HYPO|nr:hypothetical protein CDD80_6432 [Ophiocordyceps camponoti-rufipedis]